MHSVAASVGSTSSARRIGFGKHVLLADKREENARAAAEIFADAGFDASTAVVSGLFYVGGIVGFQGGGTISGALADHNAGSVSATSASAQAVGGIVGYQAAGSVTNGASFGGVTSAGSYTGGVVGVANGNPHNVDSFKRPRRWTWHGQALAILRPAKTAGWLSLTATSPGLKPARLHLAVTAAATKI